jgi:hypothetical protein
LEIADIAAPIEAKEAEKAGRTLPLTKSATKLLWP